MGHKRKGCYEYEYIKRKSSCCCNNYGSCNSCCGGNFLGGCGSGNNIILPLIVLALLCK